MAIRKAFLIFQSLTHFTFLIKGIEAIEEESLAVIAGAQCAAECVRRFGIVSPASANDFEDVYQGLACTKTPCRECLLPCHTRANGLKRCESLCSEWIPHESSRWLLCANSCQRFFAAYDQLLIKESPAIPDSFEVDHLQIVCAERQTGRTDMKVMLKWTLRANTSNVPVAFIVSVAKSHENSTENKLWRASTFSLNGKMVIDALSVTDYAFKVRVVDFNGGMALSKVVKFHINSKEKLIIDNFKVNYSLSSHSRLRAKINWRTNKAVCRYHVKLILLSKSSRRFTRFVTKTFVYKGRGTEVEFHDILFGGEYFLKIIPMWHNRDDTHENVYTFKFKVPSCTEISTEASCHKILNAAPTTPKSTQDPLIPLLFGQSNLANVRKLDKDENKEVRSKSSSFTVRKNGPINMFNRSRSPTFSNKSLLVSIIVPVSLAGLLLLVFGFYRLVHNKFSIKSAFFVKDLRPHTEKDDGYLDPYETPFTTIEFFDEIGRGEFGMVHRAHWSPGDNIAKENVAVKRLQPTRCGETEVKQFLGEISLMKQIGQHRNIVSIFACCTRPSVPLCLVMDYCERGNLHDNLLDMKPHPNNPQLSRVLLRFAFDVASGMEYLSQQSFVHRDLACRNILLTNEWVAKVADFGLSRDVYKTSLYCCDSRCRLPFRWMAPEALSRREFSTATDVWAFGVVLWEIMTLGATPFSTLNVDEILAFLGSGKRLEKPTLATDETYDVMQSCWKFDSLHRPSFTDLKEGIEALLTKSHEYLYIGCDSTSVNSRHGTESISCGYLQV